MDLCTYHSHCTFCDGKAPAEEFVKAAIEAGFHSYGVSSHSPLPFDTRWSLSKGDVEAYLQEMERLKKQYAGHIELYVGLEIDYLNDGWGPANDYFQRMPLDYRIGSVHLVTNGETGEMMDMDGSFDDFRENFRNVYHDDLKHLVRDYFRSSARMVELGGFDFVAHLDKISMNGLLVEPMLTEQAWYNELLREYLQLIAEKGVMVEVNTKAYTKKGLMFPNVKYFKWLKELNIPVMVNSDAHLPQLVNDNRELAFRLLRDAGVKSTMRLHRGVWEEVPMSEIKN
ncbi:MULTISPECIES: histidinol-phosphatase [unclassified Butyricimonas]|uniref:histidinol-phosphatase n=1 Tax=unclassified Butyricimonas TaxID=2637652 RepID=UPI000C07514A|nr:MULTISPECIES: histidinol-phosphatase [unclassified Butyricimonas]